MRCMVVLWSMDSIDSDWVKEEAEKGKAQRKLVAALIDEVKPPMGFHAIQAANMIGWDGSQNFPGFDNLIDALEARLGKPVKIPAAEPATVSEVNAPCGRQPSSPPRFDSSKLSAHRQPATLAVLCQGNRSGHHLDRRVHRATDRAPGTTSPGLRYAVTNLDAERNAKRIATLNYQGANRCATPEARSPESRRCR